MSDQPAPTAGSNEPVSIIRADWAITMDPAHGSGTGPAGVIEDAAVVMRGDTIESVGPAAEVEAAHPGVSAESLDGHVLLPGLVNAHSHLAMSMFRGVADDRDLQGFLETVLPLEASMLRGDRVRAATRAALVESHLAGVTTVLDMYFFCSDALDAAEECGARVLTGPVVFDGPAPDGPDDGWNARMQWSRRWLDSHPPTDDWSPVVGPHSIYAVSPEHLVESASLAAESAALLHIHAAETYAEVQSALTTHGRRPVELLDDLGLLRPGTVLAHGVHLTDDEIERIAGSGSAVAHCPASNLKLASGIAPVRRLLERGVPVALGTDGPASSNDLDLLGAVRLAALVHKAAAPEGPDAESLPAATVLEMATRAGATAVGMQDRLGVLRRGAVADLVALDLSGPHSQPVHDPVSAVVYTAGRGDVRDVWCRGRRVVADGRHMLVDVDDVVADLRELGALVKERS